MVPNLAIEIQRFIESFDRCWVEGRTGDLREFLHPDVVFTGPNFQRLAAGADACIKSYEDFLAYAKVHTFESRDFAIHITGTTAVVTYAWTIDYEPPDGRRRETGRDLLVLTRESGSWLITWRCQQPD